MFSHTPMTGYWSGATFASDTDDKLLAGKVFNVHQLSLSAIQARSQGVSWYEALFTAARMTMPLATKAVRRINGMFEVQACDMI